MIITTRRSRAGYLFDLLLTAGGWFAFVYLFGAGILAILRGAAGGPRSRCGRCSCPRPHPVGTPRWRGQRRGAGGLGALQPPALRRQDHAAGRRRRRPAGAQLHRRARAVAAAAPRPRRRHPSWRRRRDHRHRTGPRAAAQRDLKSRAGLGRARTRSRQRLSGALAAHLRQDRHRPAAAGRRRPDRHSRCWWRRPAGPAPPRPARPCRTTGRRTARDHADLARHQLLRIDHDGREGRGHTADDHHQHRRPEQVGVRQHQREWRHAGSTPRSRSCGRCGRPPDRPTVPTATAARNRNRYSCASRVDSRTCRSGRK